MRRLRQKFLENPILHEEAKGKEKERYYQRAASGKIKTIETMSGHDIDTSYEKKKTIKALEEENRKTKTRLEKYKKRLSSLKRKKRKLKMKAQERRFTDSWKVEINLLKLKYTKKCCLEVLSANKYSTTVRNVTKSEKGYEKLNVEEIHWHFRESACGKDVPDGVRAALKRTADGLVAHQIDIPDCDMLVPLLQQHFNGIAVKQGQEPLITSIEKYIPKYIPVFKVTKKIHEVVFKKGSHSLQSSAVVKTVIIEDLNTRRSTVHLIQEQNMNYKIRPNHNDYLIVKVTGTKSVRNYIANVTECISEEEVRVRFMTRCAQTAAKMISEEQEFIISSSDIVHVMNQPEVAAGGSWSSAMVLHLASVAAVASETCRWRVVSQLSEIGSMINTENCCTIRVQNWTGDRDEVHFEPPKLAVRNLDSRSAAINHEISLVQHFYIGTKIRLDPGTELGSFVLGSMKTLVLPGISQLKTTTPHSMLKEDWSNYEEKIGVQDEQLFVIDGGRRGAPGMLVVCPRHPESKDASGFSAAPPCSTCNTCICSKDYVAARPRSRSEGAIRATLTRTPSASSLLRARHLECERTKRCVIEHGQELLLTDRRITRAAIMPYRGRVAPVLERFNVLGW
ncbi:hypothetical protein PR048_031822 [Dryococelus australis]|uniref:Uncharacterized protein n=1 Tax=Dryococelus australis TaxID=614101 RepID=A0ABQ9G6D0_9NEOP|nr:hypothetical protein PR048_031822 [Dryococelus australis]